MPTYHSSGTLTTATKSFSAPQKPNLSGLQYSLNGQAITVEVVGSPNTSSEERATQDLDGATTYGLSWTDTHQDYQLEITLSTTDTSQTPSVDAVGLESTVLLDTYTVPSGVSRLYVDLYGGGAATADGGRTAGLLSVSPGETLHYPPEIRSGSGTGGGDASDLRQGGTSLADRAAVAGGAGGDGQADSAGVGGDGGGQTATAGETATANASTGEGGHGGSQTTGGAGGDGSGGSGGADGSDGSFGAGGSGGTASGSQGGGDGGDGYYGGGGGGLGYYAGSSAAGGGGGGSNYTGGLSTVLAAQSGVNAGDGSVELHPVPVLDSVSLNNGALVVDWTRLAPESDGGEWQIYRSTTAGSQGSQVATITDLTTTQYTDADVVDGEVYYYTVVRQYPSGASVPSEQAVAPQTPLPAPADLTHPSVGDTTAEYAWTATHDNGETRVEYRPSDISEWQTYDIVDHAVESVTVDGLRTGEIYDSRVVAETEHDSTEDQ